PPADILKLINNQSDTVRSLEKTFTQLGQSLLNKDAARVQLTALSDAAIKVMDEVEREVLKAVSQEADSSEQLDEFTNLLQLRR
nr:hypothetical protein [Tanacetum cinerariifolium]